MGGIAAEDLVERLLDSGGDTIFGLPGDGINEIMETPRSTLFRDKFSELES